ncbi:MAG: leucine-rich repeat protein, partial [Alphaproteobacteria bacterium]|nr:leucine-rich repeat protein [Alphaproteobacteria bacterium]
ATFTYGGGSIYVDCGEGTLVGGSALSSGTVSCSYTEIGDYTVKLSGDFTYFGGVSGKGIVKNIIKLDKSGITKMSKVCGSTTNGVVPPLPSTLVNATSMFNGCKAINSPYPKLPATLEVADNMFYGATKFTGSVALPEILKSAKAMFSGNTGLQSVTGLENAQLEVGDMMFYDTKPSGVVKLPSTLKSARGMFAGITTSFTIDGLENTKLEDGSSMFHNATGLANASIALPSTLTNGYYMFRGVTKLTSVSGLGETKITDGTCMFYGAGLTTFPGLPSTLSIGQAMFYNLKLTGTLSSLPSSATNYSYMFMHEDYNANPLKGTPSKPASLTSYTNIFMNTKVTVNSTWDSSIAKKSSGYINSCSEGVAG